VNPILLKYSKQLNVILFVSEAHSKHNKFTFCDNEEIHSNSPHSTSILIKSGFPYSLINLSIVIVLHTISL
jgi:hypothetical protein